MSVFQLLIENLEREGCLEESWTMYFPLSVKSDVLSYGTQIAFLIQMHNDKLKLFLGF